MLYGFSCSENVQICRWRLCYWANEIYKKMKLPSYGKKIISAFRRKMAAFTLLCHANRNVTGAFDFVRVRANVRMMLLSKSFVTFFMEKILKRFNFHIFVIFGCFLNRTYGIFVI